MLFPPCMERPTRVSPYCATPFQPNPYRNELVCFIKDIYLLEIMHQRGACSGRRQSSFRVWNVGPMPEDWREANGVRPYQRPWLCRG